VCQHAAVVPPKSTLPASSDAPERAAASSALESRKAVGPAEGNRHVSPSGLEDTVDGSIEGVAGGSEPKDPGDSKAAGGAPEQPAEQLPNRQFSETERPSEEIASDNVEPRKPPKRSSRDKRSVPPPLPRRASQPVASKPPGESAELRESASDRASASTSASSQPAPAVPAVAATSAAPERKRAETPSPVEPPPVEEPPAGGPSLAAVVAQRVRSVLTRPRTMPPDAYRPDVGSVQTARWLAVILGAVVLFSAAPALKHGNLETAPDWARVVLLVAALQAMYLAWMAATPDWSSLWIVMLVFAGTSALYGMASALAIASPLDQPIPLEMGEVRHWAGRWCVSVLLLMVLVTYLAGRYASRWRRRCELEVAAHLRDRPAPRRTK
jgi:hypothetical protein